MRFCTSEERESAVGALRLSLQTEPGNAAALALHRQRGFRMKADLATLSLNVAR